MKFDNSKLQVGQRMLIEASGAGWTVPFRKKFFTGEIIAITPYGVNFKLYDVDTNEPIKHMIDIKSEISVPYRKTKRLIKPMTHPGAQYIVYNDKQDYDEAMAMYFASVHQHNDDKIAQLESSITENFKDIELDAQQYVLRELQALDKYLQDYHEGELLNQKAGV